jgi:DNA-directed RNA polymerase specialized sigma subunit, sigma24 homolog
MPLNTDRQRKIIKFILQNYSDFYNMQGLSENLIIEKIDIDTAIDNLDKDEKDIVIMRYIQGYKVTEAAKIVCKSTFYVSDKANTALDKIAAYCL